MEAIQRIAMSEVEQILAAAHAEVHAAADTEKY